jgi:hypothetical protein
MVARPKRRPFTIGRDVTSKASFFSWSTPLCDPKKFRIFSFIMFLFFVSLLFCVIFLGSDLYSLLFSFFYFKLTFVSFFLFVCARGTLPRFRYVASFPLR